MCARDRESESERKNEGKKITTRERYKIQTLDVQVVKKNQQQNENEIDTQPIKNFVWRVNSYVRAILT